MTTLDVLAPEEQPEAAGALEEPSATAAAEHVELLAGDRWVPVCGLDHLLPGRGVAALLPDGRQAAVFRDRHGSVHAVSNRDPFTGAYVLSRGLLGSVGKRTYLASPILKQRFDLRTGECLDDEAVRIDVHPARVTVAADRQPATT